jgi:ribonucleotide monophosphatase NagD (HAD superfamily)
VEEVMGKPSPIMADVILARMALPPRDVLVTGDRLETDIALARGAGMVSALVLTGATTAEALKTSPLQPDYVLTSLSALLPPEVSA